MGGGKLFFWDGDDTIEPYAIEECVRFSEKYGVRSVLYSYANSINGKKGVPHQHELKKIYQGKEIVEELLPHFLGHSFSDVNQWIKGKRGMRQGKEHTALWRIMLDTDTIRKNGLKFDTSLTLGEDTRFICEYMLHETSMGFMDKCLYYLTIRESGANLTSKSNAEKRLADKTKLISARKELDSKAVALHSIDTHTYWEGTLVFSAVEMALRMAKNKNKSIKENYRMYIDFIGNKEVSNAIFDFCPSKGLKAIPFYMIKSQIGRILLFSFSVLIPKRKKY